MGGFFLAVEGRWLSGWQTASPSRRGGLRAEVTLRSPKGAPAACRAAWGAAHLFLNFLQGQKKKNSMGSKIVWGAYFDAKKNPEK